MKQETSSQEINVEKLPVNNGQNVEKLSDLDSPELGNTKGIEAFEKRSELNAVMADVSSSTASASVNNGQVTIGSTLVSGNPLVANDDDKIEKEWVDKAKKIIAETQNNPHLRDKKVNELQVDYLKKRFGRELGVAE